MLKNREELSNLLGMEEMETALEIMLQKAEKSDTPFHKLVVKLSDFQPETEVGFLHLLYQGWVVPHRHKQKFLVSKQLVKQMRTRECWKEMPYPKGKVKQ